MTGFVVRRLLLALPTLLLISAFVFFLQKLMPGDVALALAGEDRSVEVIEHIRRKYQLDQPLWVQYLAWAKAVVQGDLGHSIMMRAEVGPLLMQKLAVTLQLSLMAMVIALAVGIPAGVLAAVHQGTATDYWINVFALSGLSVPNFWLGILMILVISVHLGWLPASGYVSFRTDPWQSLRTTIMPASVLGLSIAGMLMRHSRSAMLDVLRADYMRTARSKGLSSGRIVIVHGLRNALVPIVTFSSVIFGELLAGAVLTEQVFSVPGLGKMIVDAVFTRDYAVVQGVVLLSATIFLLANLAADIATMLLNPRTRK